MYVLVTSLDNRNKKLNCLSLHFRKNQCILSPLNNIVITAKLLRVSKKRVSRSISFALCKYRMLSFYAQVMMLGI